MSLTNKKTARSNILGKILGINSNRSSSSPDLEVIRKMKDRAQTDNPLFRLSIADYEFMCKDEKALGIMSKLLDTDIKKLRKICKQIHIFLENINSSPETIKNKMKATQVPILKLPEDLRGKIAGIFNSLLSTKHILRKGIPIDKLEKESLSSNPNAIEYLLEHPQEINWGNLSGNPKAIHLLEEKYKEENKLSKEELANIPNDKKIDWRALSSNPEADELIKAKYKKEQLSPDNTNALSIIERLNWRNLSGNPCALEILKVPENRHKIDWRALSGNPNPDAEVLLKVPENTQGIVWNPPSPAAAAAAINLQDISAEQNDKPWANLSINPNAIDLLVKRVAYEEALPKDEFAKLKRINKINWYYLTINPAIFI
jgi:hypothetical protein